MTRLLLALALFAAAQTGATVPVLHITVVVPDADGRPRAVPRHALLISDNPVTAAPQRVVTNIDGAANVRLKPGNYTIESDEPLIFAGKSYQWAQTVDVRPGRDTVLELTAGNAIVEAAAAGASSPAMNAASEASAILSDWQSSVVAIWSPKKTGAGVLIDARGLIATNQRLVGNASSAEVQLSPDTKVPARVIAVDANANVAILWVDPKAVATSRPVRLAVAQEGKAPVAEGDSVFAIEASVGERKTLASGTVTRVATHTITSDLHIDRGDAGVAVFNAAGDVIALTTVSDDATEGGEVSSRAIRIDDVRAAIAEAVKKIQNAQPPGGTLPIEPRRPFPEEALRDAARARSGSLSAYLLPASDFEVALLTPVLIYAAHHQGDRERGNGPRNPGEMQPGLRALEDFGNWSDYVNEYPAVLMVRATPKLVEGFWTTVARGAAQTQGVSVPPIKKVKTGFARLRLFCGDAEVTPIHPFRIEHPVDDKTTIDEGLYVFDPDAIGPQCNTVKLMLYSEKEPDKPDTRIVDRRVVDQVYGDFAPYRGGGRD